MDILLGPIYSLFSVSFYKRVLGFSFWKGFLYLCFLSLVYGVLFLVFLFMPFRGQADRFVSWFAEHLPQLTLTKEGVLAEVQQPFEVKHPMYGSILVIDTTKASLETMPETLIYLTKTKLIFRNEARGQYRVFNLAPESEEAKAQWKNFMITGPFLESWYYKLVPLAYPAVLIFIFLFFLIWKLLAALFYSLIALIIHLFRKEKLSYRSLFVCSIFALSPVIVLQWAGMFIPRIYLVLNFFTALVLTALYLAFGILATQARAESPGPQPPA